MIWPLFFNGIHSVGFDTKPPSYRFGVLARGITLNMLFMTSGVGLLYCRAWARKLALCVLVVSTFYSAYEFAFGFAHGRPSRNIILMSFAFVGGWNAIWFYLIYRKSPSQTLSPAEQPPPLLAREITSGAGFKIRLIARLIDAALGLGIGFTAGIVLAMLQLKGIISLGGEHHIHGLSLTGLCLSLLGAIMYHAATEGIHGASLGKLLCKLRVVTTDGLRCNLAKALLRSLAYYLDSLFFGLVGYNSMQKSPLNQRYGDVWAKTVVVRTTDAPYETQRPLWVFFTGFFLGSASWISIMGLGMILK